MKNNPAQSQSQLTDTNSQQVSKTATVSNKAIVKAKYRGAKKKRPVNKTVATKQDTMKFASQVAPKQISQALLSVAVEHANFDDTRTPIDPARPLIDIPEPARRNQRQIKSIIPKKATQPYHQSANQHLVSKWQLIQSPELEEHLNLLQAGQLAKLPTSFYKNSSQQPLLRSLTQMHMLDLADITNALVAYPNLTRYGLQPNEPICKTLDNDNVDLQTLDHAADWEAILYPEHFDDGMGHIATDIMACSIVVHVLKQCDTRQSVNSKITATKIVQYVRSYVLAECMRAPMLRDKLRHSPIFVGHIMMAAHHLGWQISIETPDNICFNVASRCGLFTRYPVLADYYINGWK